MWHENPHHFWTSRSQVGLSVRDGPVLLTAREELTNQFDLSSLLNVNTAPRGLQGKGFDRACRGK
jgi:hypothetical protein